MGALRSTRCRERTAIFYPVTSGTSNRREATGNSKNNFRRSNYHRNPFQTFHRYALFQSSFTPREFSNVKTGQAVAVGNLAFVDKVKIELGAKALHRELEQTDETYALREPGEAYRPFPFGP
jgi:hypothetical protein